MFIKQIKLKNFDDNDRNIFSVHNTNKYCKFFEKNRNLEIKGN